MSRSDDTTPSGSSRETTGDLQPLDLAKYQLRELRHGFKQTSDDIAKILATLHEIRSDLKVGAFKMDNHAERITGIESKADRGMIAIIGFVCMAGWEVFKHAFMKDPR